MKYFYNGSIDIGNLNTDITQMHDHDSSKINFRIPSDVA